MMQNQESLLATLRKVAKQCPTDVVDEEVRHIPRIAFNIWTLTGGEGILEAI